MFLLYIILQGNVNGENTVSAWRTELTRPLAGWITRGLNSPPLIPVTRPGAGRGISDHVIPHDH